MKKQHVKFESETILKWEEILVLSRPAELKHVFTDKFVYDKVISTLPPALKYGSKNRPCMNILFTCILEENGFLKKDV